MRKVTICVVLGLVAALASAAGCGDETSETTTGGTDVCTGTLPPNQCFVCVENSCCAELSACLDDTGCADCIAGNSAACSSSLWQDVVACGSAKCQAPCEDLATKIPACDAPDPAPSGGSCVTIGGANTCNPITNEGCDTAAGQACDYSSGYKCYPPPNDVALCDECNPDAATPVNCGPGLSCVTRAVIASTGVNITRACARTCCDDGDCGTGYCKFDLSQEGKSAGRCLEVVP
jgi:hypothetical protein